jgi:hypothetical protein
MLPQRGRAPYDPGHTEAVTLVTEAYTPTGCQTVLVSKKVAIQ